MEMSFVRLSTFIFLLFSPVLQAKIYYQEFQAPKFGRFEYFRDSDQGIGLSIQSNSKRVEIHTTRTFDYDDHIPSIFVTFTGKTLESKLEILRDKEDVPIVDQKIVIPSTYTVKFRARAAGGKTINGVLVTHCGPSPSTTINGHSYGRFRVHYRLDATISDPSLLGLKSKKFTYQKTVRHWLSNPDGP